MFSIQEILDLAIRLENNGESVYRHAVDEVSEPELVSLLQWMADEELEHAKWFSELKQKFKTHSTEPFMAEMSREVFADFLGEKSFSHQDVDFSKIDRVGDLVAVFIEFEKDTILFYETLKPFIEDKDTLNNLEKIIAEENKHIAQLHQFLADEAKISAVDD
ncbi:MAG: ferritin family protein [Desulfobacterales bacterium]|jgi:rubrerythrin